jgi:hypothetical protein
MHIPMLSRTENKTRIIKMTSLQGEYILLGRKTEDESNIFVQYGQGATRTVNVTGGAGLQEAEFIDGLRFSMTATAPMTMNVEIRSDVSQETVPEGFTAISMFCPFHIISTHVFTAGPLAVSLLLRLMWNA